MSDTDLKEKEASAGEQAPNPAQADEADKLGGLYKKEGGGRRFRLTRKQATAGGIGGLAVTGGALFMIILPGPLQAIHLAKVLSNAFFSRNDETGDISTRRLYNTISDKRELNNLGPLASALAKRQRAKLEGMGIKSDFTNPDGKARSTLQAMEVDITTPEGKKMWERAVELNADIDYSTGNARINMRGSGNRSIGKNLTKFSVELSGKKGISGWLTKRRLIRLHGVNFHPHNIAKKRGESIKDRYDRRKRERAQDITEGSDVGDGRRTSADTDDDGNPREPDSDIADGANNAADQIDGIKKDSDPISRRQKVKSFMKSPLFKTGATAGAIVSVACGVKDLGDSIEKYKMDNVIKPMIRLVSNTVSSGSQHQSNQDMNIQEAEIANEPFYDEVEKTSVFGAKPMKTAVGEEGGTEIDPATKTQYVDAYNGNKPALFDAIDNVPLVDQVCGANNAIGNLPLVKQFGDFTSKLTSGLSSAITGKSQEEWMGELVATLSGGAVDVLASGDTLGQILGPSAVLAANASSIPTGGTELDEAQVSAWNGYIEEERMARMKELPLKDRLFDIYSPDSLAGRLSIKTAPYTANPGHTIASLAKSPLISIASAFGNVFSFLTHKTNAYEIKGYDYGLPEFGVPLDQLESDRYANVFDNIDRLEANDFKKLKDGNEKWGKCFGNPIDNKGNLTDKDVTSYEHVDDCNGDFSKPDFQDYRMYIQDANTIRTMACYEGIDDKSCEQIGFGVIQEEADPADLVGPSGIPPGGYKGTDTSAQTCKYGTDAGLGVTPDPNTKIRLCRLGSFTVNVAIEQNLKSILDGAAAAGVKNVGGTSYRSNETQIQLRRKHCGPTHYDIYEKPSNQCKPPTARPGNSMHEWGLAIDFSQNGRRLEKTHSLFSWLSNNTATHKLKNLASEPWHWSSTGN